METAEVRASNSERHKAVQRLLLAAAVIASVIAVATVDMDKPGSLAGWMYPADRFGPSPDGQPTVFISAGVEVGDTVVALMMHTTEPIQLDDIEAVVGDTSALAAVELVACRHREGTPTPGAVVGEPLSDYCESVHRPTEVSIGPAATGEVFILAVVQPLEPGRVYIDGVRATHSRGPLDRTEHTGSGLEIEVG